MSRFRAYLERQQPLKVIQHLSATANSSTLFVTIPCYDEPDLLTTLNSLADCDPPFFRRDCNCCCELIRSLIT